MHGRSAVEPVLCKKVEAERSWAESASLSRCSNLKKIIAIGHSNIHMKMLGEK
jgi:hypothetical protein